VLFLLLPWAALADGKVFPRGEFDPSQVPIPDQRAMIHWAGGVERLVIETSFAGPGTNFAWVVPLPAVPEIEQATPGLFPTLNRIFLPAVDLSGDRWFVGFGWFVLGSWAVLRRDRLASTHQIWLTVVAFVWGMVWANHVMDFVMALLGTLVLLVVSADLRRRRDPAAKSDLMALILLLMSLLVLAGMLLLALGPASTRGIGSGDTAGSGVEVLARTKTERFDVAVVTGTNAAVLTDWLRDRGYAASSEVAPVISNYVRQGWVFATARLIGAEAGATNATPPLSFRFASAEPVYPMALTGGRQSWTESGAVCLRAGTGVGVGLESGPQPAFGPGRDHRRDSSSSADFLADDGALAFEEVDRSQHPRNAAPGVIGSFRDAAGRAARMGGNGFLRWFEAELPHCRG
jgi:hypothetical protein